MLCFFEFSLFNFDKIDKIWKELFIYMDLGLSRSFQLDSFKNYACLKLILVFDGGRFLQFFTFFVYKTNNDIFSFTIWDHVQVFS